MNKNYIPQLAFCIIGAVIPIILWVAGPDPQLLFADWYLTLTTIGKAAGITGMCFFAGNLILSGRYRWLDRGFGGLDRVYRFHRKIGVVAFALLSGHALAISVRLAAISWESFYRSATDLWDPVLNYGRISYAGLLIIVALTLALSGRIKYEYLKKLHQFLGAFLFIGGLHAYFIPSDIAQNQYLRAYTLGLVGLAMASYLWRTVLRRWLIPKIICTVTEVNLLNGNVTEVIMQPTDGKKITFLPGQFIFVKFKQAAFPYEEHPFSLTASPVAAQLSIAAKKIGDFTSQLPRLQPGAVAHIRGPFGGFSFLRAGGKKQIWIAGGIGVTPFVSMAKALRDGADRTGTTAYNICMIHSVQKAQDLVFRRELEEIARARTNFKFVPWITAKQGYLTAQVIQRYTNFSDQEIFICGPKPMMLTLRRQLVAMGVPRARIHYELFRLL